MIRLTAASLVIFVASVCSTASAQMLTHPFLNNTTKTWQVKFDREHPNNGFHAVQLAVIKFGPTAPAGSPQNVQLKLRRYLFNAATSKCTSEPEVTMYGSVEGMLVDMGKFRRKLLKFSANGQYVNPDTGEITNYTVKGYFHPGDNRDPANADNRKDDRIVLRVSAKPSTTGGMEPMPMPMPTNPSADPCDEVTPDDVLMEGDDLGAEFEYLFP